MRERLIAPFISNFGFRWGGGVTFTFQDLYPRGKEPLVLNEQEGGWAPEPAWLLWRRKNALAHGGNLSLFHWFFSPWSAQYTD